MLSSFVHRTIDTKIPRVCFFRPDMIHAPSKACISAAENISRAEGVSELLSWHCTDATKPEIMDKLGLTEATVVFLYAYPTLLAKLEVGIMNTSIFITFVVRMSVFLLLVLSLSRSIKHTAGTLEVFSWMPKRRWVHYLTFSIFVFSHK